jgi:hypothetical protein
VNTKSREALAPRDFSVRAGRSGNAAEDTTALADAMKGEEEEMTAPIRQPVVQPSPAVRPPAMTYSPQDLARVQAQRPVPSTMVPATQDAWNTSIGENPEGAAQFFKANQLMQNYDYNQNIQRDVASGIPYDEAVRKRGPMPFVTGRQSAPARPVNQQFHQGGAFNPATGTWTPIEGIKAPPAKLSDVERIALGSSLREVETEEANARKELNAAQKAIAEATGDEVDKQTAKANAALASIASARARRQKIVAGAGQTQVAPTIAETARPSIKLPTPKIGESRNGYRFTGGDPSKKSNWEKL